MYKRGSQHQSTLSAALFLGAAAFFLVLLLSPALTAPDALQVGAAPPEDFSYTISGDTLTITGYNGPGGDVEIPAEIDGVAVTGIGQDAFSDSGLTGDLIIPGSVTDIGDSAFSGCSGLTAVTIPDGVINIWERAFYGCVGLTG
ncbi:MAG: leucine-rich repeat domain-containing protein, partial [Gracilibacteraceae bacterium]|nr:leucine-rich repeat domain-containing protein [Gracilibacteraceae bacterium]